MQFQERDRIRSLKDLAENAEPPRKPTIASSDSSGFVDLAAIQKADPDWLENAIARAKSGNANAAPSEAAERAPRKEPESSLDEASFFFEGATGHRARSNTKLRNAVFGVAGALVFLGGLGFVLKAGRAPAAAAPAPSVTAESRPAPMAVAPPIPSDIPAPPPVSAAEETPSNARIELDDPAPSDDAPAGRKHGSRGAHAHASAAREAAATPAPARPAKGGAGAGSLAARLAGGDAVAAAPTAPAAPANPLTDAIKSAAGPSAPVAARAAQAPAAAAPASNLPDRPSGSVVTSVLKGALPAARACVADGEDVSRAAVTFGSNGNVSHIDVSGPAAAKPREASCIKGAFGKAKLPAFAQPSYTATVSVRPN